jgi:3-oxoadipate enol-lactonase
MRHRLAPVNGIDLAYTVEGQGPALVLVHGLACGRRMWLHQVRHLRSDYAVIAYDQRGHGQSGAPETAQGYSAAHLTRDLVGLLDHLGIARCHLVGFSLGGGPALVFASSMPDRVASLVLADVGAGAESPFLLPSLARRWISLAESRGMSALADEMLRGEFFRSYANRSRRARCHMRALIESTPLHGLVFTLSEVLAKRKSLFRMTGVLRSIQVPTLVLRGEGDNVCRSATKLLLQTIPGARAAITPGAGHMAPLEAPAAFSVAVQAFVQTCPASATLPQISRPVMTG